MRNRRAGSAELITRSWEGEEREKSRFVFRRRFSAGTKDLHNGLVNGS